ncbi:MAG TPA: Na+/H+ antiporter [Candidatus Baltobacteraceae bacterium]|nr:Na+/H+ antiporter [Candidatus Baltobacteraceae bacterium]
MSAPVLLVIGLALTIALAILARRLELPYPIVFVLAGTALAFVPGLPPVRIPPDWIFFVVLPPLLFSAAWGIDWIIFRGNLRPILQLAIGLVIATTLAVAFVADKLVPALGIAGAFVLGAIVSPPDPVAASATFERFTIPRRIVAVVEGEGLLNDATALVIYGYAVAAAASTVFSLSAAAQSFVIVVIGGVALGAGIAFGFEALARALQHYELSDSLIENFLLIACPYIAYSIGQTVHVSGVLAVVIAGITISRRSTVVYGPQTRLVAYNVWNLWVYVLNAYVFLAIGLHLRAYTASGFHFLTYLPAALAISAVAIVVRLLWMFPAAWIPRLIPAVRRADPLPPSSWITLIGWTGMRGIVSLAAALALPRTFAQRDVIVFITFVVIFVTLVGQGLTLSPLMRWLHVEREGDENRHELEIRLRALEAGVRRLEHLRGETTDHHALEDIEALRNEYDRRVEHLRENLDGATPAPRVTEVIHSSAEVEALRAERFAVMALRDSGEIPDDIFRRIQYDLDLAESRLS